ncbi:MAG: type II toxin-antitoxin system RelE/ParE family toxin [Candidatus Kapabacteria bacterium]|nr:type II toxin-antitoxin system RelE/ParE family toxin [Candidatus Kapabacteria bacterium]
MKIKFHKNSIKFLEKCNTNDKERIRVKLKDLLNLYNGTKISNLTKLNIKNLEGEWKGFKRLKIGKIRVIFRVSLVDEEIEVFEIDFRGDIYK